MQDKEAGLNPLETGQTESGQSSTASAAEKKVRILFVADIVGKPGMDVLSTLLPGLIKKNRLDLVIVNGENSDDGRGITEEIVNTLYEIGVDVITSGNHIWDKAPIRKKFKKYPRLLRPVNYPSGSGGHGSVVVETKSGVEIAVLNLQGRTYLPPIDCPFRIMDRELASLKKDIKVIFVDFHAESTAEKQALGWYLDGRVSALIGTHTHIQTADERILPEGTGYLTDGGMTGSFDSVIGMSTSVAIRRLMTQTPQPFKIAEKNLRLNGALLEVNAESGRCLKIERLNLP